MPTGVVGDFGEGILFSIPEAIANVAKTIAYTKAISLRCGLN
jgi:hypothetical protein